MWVQALLHTPPEPAGGNHVLFEHFWLERGPVPLPEAGQDLDAGKRPFVQTASVRQHLCNLARAVLIRCAPPPWRVLYSPGRPPYPVACCTHQAGPLYPVACCTVFLRELCVLCCAVLIR